MLTVSQRRLHHQTILAGFLGKFNFIFILLSLFIDYSFSNPKGMLGQSLFVPIATLTWAGYLRPIAVIKFQPDFGVCVDYR